MATNEKISKGLFYRRCLDAAEQLWERISFWTAASDVECDDGNTVENKVGSIKGITTSTNVTETGYAADAKTVSSLNSSLSSLNTCLTNENTETFNFGVKNGVRGFYTNSSRADDSFVPFKSSPKRLLLCAGNNFCEDVTGGWYATGGVDSYYHGTVATKKNDAWQRFGTNNPIDITDYDRFKFYIYVSYASSGTLILSRDKDRTNVIQQFTTSQAFNDIDISVITGEIYISFYFYNSTFFSGLYLEKND